MHRFLLVKINLVVNVKLASNVLNLMFLQLLYITVKRERKNNLNNKKQLTLKDMEN